MDAPVSPVFDIAQTLENPYVHERDSVLSYSYPNGDSASMIASPIRVPRVTQIDKLCELGVIAGSSLAEHGVAQDSGHAAGP